MSFFKEFKEFAMKGNVVDMAVGIIIGAAFGKVVTSLVEHVLMPPLGVIVGGIDFSSFEAILREPTAPNIAAVSIRYGMFIQTLINFTIQAFAIFLVVKAMNTIKRVAPLSPASPPPAPPPQVSNQELLLAEIRDLLKKS